MPVLIYFFVCLSVLIASEIFVLVLLSRHFLRVKGIFKLHDPINLEATENFMGVYLFFFVKLCRI